MDAIQEFKDRIQSVLTKIRIEKRSVRENCEMLKASRKGDYLIKVSKNSLRYYYEESSKYIDFTYSCDGWLAFSCRKDAQWFSGKEGHAIIKRLGKGFSLVKR